MVLEHGCMTTFRFKVYNPKSDKVRRGTLEAVSIEEAKKEILSHGFEILELKKESKLVFSTRGSTAPKVDLGQPDQREYRLSILDRLKMKLPVNWSTYAALILLGLGLPLLVLYWTPRETGSSSYKDVVIHLKGRLSAGQKTQETLVVRLPEVPLQVRYPIADVVDEVGEFEVELSFSAERLPSRCQIVLFDGDKETYSRSALLRGEPLTASLDLSELP